MDFGQEYTIRGTNPNTRRKNKIKVTARNEKEAESIALFKGLIPPFEFFYDFPEIEEGIKNLVLDGVEVVDVKTFINYLDNPNLKTENIKVYSTSYGDALEVIFDNGKKIAILTQSFSTNFDCFKFAEGINYFIQTHNLKIVGVKVTPKKKW